MSLNRPSYFFMIVFFVDMNCNESMLDMFDTNLRSERTNVSFLDNAILKDACAKPLIDC